MPCVRCGQSHSNPTAFLLLCSECHRSWHHRCHVPPVEDQELIARINATNNNDVDNGLDGWVCRRCSKRMQSVLSRPAEKRIVSQTPLEPSKSPPLSTSEYQSVPPSNPLPIQLVHLIQSNVGAVGSQSEPTGASRSHEVSPSRRSSPAGQHCQDPPSQTSAGSKPIDGRISPESTRNYPDAPPPPFIDLSRVNIRPSGPSASLDLRSGINFASTSSIPSTLTNQHEPSSDGVHVETLCITPPTQMAILGNLTDLTFPGGLQDFQTSNGNIESQTNIIDHHESEVMDIDTVHLIPVDAEKTFCSPATSRALSPVHAQLSGGAIHAEPTAVAQDIQMDVDDDWDDLYWDPPAEQGIPMTHVLEDGPPTLTPSTSEPMRASPAIQPQSINTPDQEAIRPDQCLTIWMRARHSDGSNPWSSRDKTSLERKRKLHSKVKASKLETDSRKEKLIAFSLADWVFKERHQLQAQDMARLTLTGR